MITWGKYILLSGGIDFAEEAVYNDVYMLDTETWIWMYVGEAGEIVTPRNSHSLAVVEGADGNEYLTIFGGASPELGPLGDTYFAQLPKDQSGIDDKFYVEWKALKQENVPAAREMHSTSSLAGTAYVIGGRSVTGENLSDVWTLSKAESSDSEAIQWCQVAALELPAPRCAHASSIIRKPDGHSAHLCVFGGFDGTGISGDLFTVDLTKGQVGGWAKRDFTGELNIPARFGHCMSSSQDTGGQTCSDTFVFGGVCIEQDFSDLWLTRL
jgi:hypothetical protein